MSEKKRPLRDLSELARNRQIEPIVKRIREAVDDAGGPKAVAQLCDVPLSTFSGYLSGREVKLSIASRIADVCGVSLDWLATGRGQNDAVPLKISKPPQQDVCETENSNVSIPQYTGNASAGNGSYAANVESYAVINIGRDALPPIVLSRLSSLVAVTVRGDSMIPSLYDCDTIFVDTKDCEIITGAVYVLRRDTDLLVKRLSWSVTGDLIVSSDNPLYKPEQISAAKARQLFEDGGLPIAIVGRVIWRMGIMGAS
ncbi:hypothetical protein HK16_10815 [Acetobacter senegalensis]|uniref:HTH cro/C1-type domain-containing protein n=2 Tax=Acetobacter TaxID=434 RepID=A0A252EIW1_9PROT|nr:MULTISPECIES: LexA family transcriptional regulator [Acetobacter]ATJ89390.1 hypothetical protein CIW82_00330 [Acetobacter tropicalis]OUL66357.1 hypothetical protein HK16_10815 [Acetobacter senegalensis]